MGLDSIWAPPEGVELPEPIFDPPLKLCGGLFSGHGQGSFRGKVYDGLIREVTGVTLYQKRIPNEEVMHMAKKLREWIDRRVCDELEDPSSEAMDLVRMFEAYADAGFELLGWW